jgi:hypothetical protein
VPTTLDAAQNELLINWADKIIYTKNAAGTIVSVPLGGTSTMNPFIRSVLFGS